MKLEKNNVPIRKSNPSIALYKLHVKEMNIYPTYILKQN